MEKQTLVKEICPTTTQAWVKDGALLVDVREMDEVAALDFDVPAILHIPLSEFENRFEEIPRNQLVVVVCKSGARSLRAAGFLIHHGYNPEQVVNMQHGMDRWVVRNFPVIGNTEEYQVSSSDACCSTSSENTKCC